MERTTEQECVAAWLERKHRLPIYGFYPKAVAREVGLPLTIVEAQLRKMVTAGEVNVRFWDVYCSRCDQSHEFSSPKEAAGQICLRCGQELDPTQAVPLYSFGQERSNSAEAEQD